MKSRWSRATPLFGVAFVVLFAVSSALSGSEPSAQASTPKVLSFYTSNTARHNAAYYLSGLAIVAGLFFYAFLWDHLRQAEDSPLLATAAFGGAIVFAVGGAIGIGSELALTNAPAGMSASTAQALNVLQDYLSAVAIEVGVVMLLVAAGAAILHGRGLPGWVGWLGVLLGVVTLIPVPNLGVLTAAVWTLVVSVVFVIRPRLTVREGERSGPSAVQHTS